MGANNSFEEYGGKEHPEFITRDEWVRKVRDLEQAGRDKKLKKLRRKALEGEIMIVIKQRAEQISIQEKLF